MGSILMFRCEKSRRKNPNLSRLPRRLAVATKATFPVRGSVGAATSRDAFGVRGVAVGFHGRFMSVSLWIRWKKST